MKKFIIPLIIAPLVALGQPTVEWSNYPGGVSVAVDATDHVYTTYGVYNPAGDIHVIKRNSDGLVIWDIVYDNTDNSRHELSTWIGVDNDQNILVSGTIRSGYASPVNANGLLMKFDPEGTLLWRVVYDTDFDGSYSKKFVIDDFNNIYLLGRNGSPAVSEIKKFSPEGDILWTYLDNDGIGNPLNIKLTPDNHLVISGRWVYGSGGGFSKVDTDGNLIWSSAGYSLTAGDVAGDNFGNSYITDGQYDFDYGSYLTKVSPTGDTMWQVENTMSAYRVEVGTDQNPVISGFPSSGSAGAAFMKYDSEGNVLWENMDADGPGYSLLLHAHMILDELDNVYLAAGSLFEMNVCKIHADGSEGWTVGVSGSSYASAIALGTDLSVYMAGGTIAKIAQELVEPICDTPSGLFSNNITSNTARVNWGVLPDLDQYEVWYKKTSAASWKKKFVPATKNKLNLKNLQPSTNYVWKIRSVCDSTGTDFVSDFSADQYFTTLPLRTGLEENALTMVLFPNPTDNVIHIGFQSPAYEEMIIEIYDISGNRLHYEAHKMTENIQIVVKDWPAGLYQAIVTSGNEVMVTSFIKQ